MRKSAQSFHLCDKSIQIMNLMLYKKLYEKYHLRCRFVRSTLVTRTTEVNH